MNTHPSPLKLNAFSAYNHGIHWSTVIPCCIWGIGRLVDPWPSQFVLFGVLGVGVEFHIRQTRLRHYLTPTKSQAHSPSHLRCSLQGNELNLDHPSVQNHFSSSLAIRLVGNYGSGYTSYTPFLPSMLESRWRVVCFMGHCCTPHAGREAVYQVPAVRTLARGSQAGPAACLISIYLTPYIHE